MTRPLGLLCLLLAALLLLGVAGAADTQPLTLTHLGLLALSLPLGAGGVRLMKETP